MDFKEYINESKQYDLKRLRDDFFGGDSYGLSDVLKNLDKDTVEALTKRMKINIKKEIKIWEGIKKLMDDSDLSRVL